MTSDQLIVKRVFWPKILMFLFAIVCPSIAVGVSNKEVFPDALWIATIGIIVTIGISAISTYFSGNAAPTTRKYALWHDFAVAGIMCVTFLFHFQVAREVSAAKQARTASQEKGRNDQENMDRDVQRKLALTQAEVDLAKVEADKLKEQRRMLLQLPPSQRRAIQPMPTPANAATDLPAFVSSSAVKPAQEAASILTPEEVRMSWFSYLFWATAAEILCAVLGGMVLMMVWQWDVDGDGIADDVQPPVNKAQPGQSIQMGFPTTAAPSTAKVPAQPNTTISHGSNFTPPPNF